MIYHLNIDMDYRCTYIDIFENIYVYIYIYKHSMIYFAYESKTCTYIHTLKACIYYNISKHISSVYMYIYIYMHFCMHICINTDAYNI